MRKITALRMEYTYSNAADSEARMNRFYDWLINKAIDNLLERQKNIDNNSTQKYTKDNGQSGAVSYARRSSQNPQGQENHSLQDGQSGKTTGNKNWQGLENKQRQTSKGIGG